ncbi:MAG TPA: phage holin family protein [Chloroflexota bacterium]
MAHPADHIKEERPTGAAAPKDDRSLGDLFSDLSRETTTLIRQEVDLAKTELTHKATEVGKDAAFLAAGALVAYAGFLTLVAMLVIALVQLGVTWWLSALIVGVVVLGAGGFLVMSGINSLKRTSLAPTETIETLKEDAQWAKQQTG